MNQPACQGPTHHGRLKAACAWTTSWRREVAASSHGPWTVRAAHGPWTVHGGVKWQPAISKTKACGRAVHGRFFTLAAAGVNETKRSEEKRSEASESATARTELRAAIEAKKPSRSFMSPTPTKRRAGSPSRTTSRQRRRFARSSSTATSRCRISATTTSSPASTTSSSPASRAAENDHRSRKTTFA